MFPLPTYARDRDREGALKLDDKSEKLSLRIIHVSPIK